MLAALHNPYTFAALLLLIVAVAVAHVWRHDSPALILDGVAVLGVAVLTRSAAWTLLPVALYLVRWYWRPTTQAERDLARRADWLLPGASRAAQRAPATGATVALPGAVVAQRAPAVPEVRQSARPMAPAEWMHAVNDDPTAPHLGVVGPSRHGKTTFVLAAVGRRPGEVVICTPKSAVYDSWNGADVARPVIDLETQQVSWQPIEASIGAVHFEMLRRNVESDTDSPQLTLIIDELSTILQKVARVTHDQLLDVWAMGAAARIRVIVIATDVSARAWRLEGRRDILDNLQFAQVGPGRAWSLGRLDPNNRLTAPIPLDTTPLLTLAGEARLAGREWAVPRRRPAPHRGGDAGAWSVPGPSVPQGEAPSPAPNADGRTDGRTDAAMLQRLRAAGVTRDQARQAGFQFSNDDWTAAN